MVDEDEDVYDALPKRGMVYLCILHRDFIADSNYRNGDNSEASPCMFVEDHRASLHETLLLPIVATGCMNRKGSG